MNPVTIYNFLEFGKIFKNNISAYSETTFEYQQNTTTHIEKKSVNLTVNLIGDKRKKTRKLMKKVFPNNG